MYHSVHCSAIYNSQDMETTDEKEAVVHTYSGILLSHKKGRNWVICGDVDGPRVCHIE